MIFWKNCFLVLLFISFSLITIQYSKAQSTTIVIEQNDSLTNVIKGGIPSKNNIGVLLDSEWSINTNDSINPYYRDANGLIQLPFIWQPFGNNISFRDTIIYDPLFLPVVFDGNILPSDLDFLSKETPKPSIEYHLIAPDSTFTPYLEKNKEVQEIRSKYYINNPTKVKFNAFKFDGIPSIDQEVIQKKNPFKELISTTNSPTEMIIPEIQKYEIKQVFWTVQGEHELKASLSKISANWNGTGGDDYYDVQNYHRITLNYKKKKLSFKNTFEWRLDLQNTPADTVHKIYIQNDYIRIYNVLGIDAYKKWSYTIKSETKTPLFSSYPQNSTQKKNALFSPLIITAGIGMSYNLEKASKNVKSRKMKFSADLSPLSINYTFIGDKGVDGTNFGVDDGHRSKLDLGSSVNLSIVYDLNYMIRMESRFKYFTNYKRVIAESENKFSLQLNRYLSASINLYGRYDDGIGIENKLSTIGYFQYNTKFGFGLNYKW